MDILVRNSSELKDAFASANDGDVIKLAPGSYGSTRLRNKDFETDLTITSANPSNRAVFDDYLEFNDVSGVTIEGIDVQANLLAPAFSFSRLQVVSSQDVTLRDMSIQGHKPTSGEGVNPSSASRLDPITGYGYEYGMRVRWSEDVVVDDVEFSDLRVALSVGESRGTQITNLDIHDVREGINLNDLHETLIEGNWIHDLQPFHSDHPDMIQFWGTDEGIHGLTIQNNLLDQPDGWTQSIFGHFRGRPDHVTGSDFVISGNTIINGHINAIRIREIDGFEIKDNVLLPNNPGNTGGDLPHITVLDSSDGLVSGNYLLPRWNGSLLNENETAWNVANINVQGNVALSSDPDDDLYWANFLQGAPSSPGSDEGGEADEAESGGEKSSRSPDSKPEKESSGMEGEAEDSADGAEDHAEGQEPAEPQGDVVGSSADDELHDEAGNTFLTGLEGGDQFIFNFGTKAEGSHDEIADFSFDEGDRLVFSTEQPGTFEDTANPGNDMLILDDGADVHIRSAEDLLELASGDSMTVQKSDQGLALFLNEMPQQTIELLGIMPQDLFA